MLQPLLNTLMPVKYDLEVKYNRQEKGFACIFPFRYEFYY